MRSRPALAAVLLDSESEEPPTANATTAGAVFTDSFSDPASGWFRYESPAVRLRYADGAYEFLVKVPNWRARADTAFSPSASSLEDVTVSAVAADRGSALGSYGVVCRSTGSGSYYALEIGADGDARIGKVSGGRFSLLGSSRVSPPGPSTRVQGRCTGGRAGQAAVLTLSIDGRRTLSARDREEPFGVGATGLIVESFERGGVRVSFDNFVVRRVET